VLSTCQTIKAWAENDRPREKFINKGRTALSDAELIAILIGSGSPSESAVQLSQRILAEAGNSLNLLARKNVEELKKFRGIGEAKALTIAAAMELGRRRKEIDFSTTSKIKSSKDAFECCKENMMDLDHEEFRVLYLNRSNVVIKNQLISTGGITGTVVDTRMVLKNALECLACSMILVHNHPSGNPKPSHEDISITKKISEAARLMDISVLDHLIIFENKYTSFADEGLL
jgi:DNA repair protein RadC